MPPLFTREFKAPSNQMKTHLASCGQLMSYFAQRNHVSSVILRSKIRLLFSARCLLLVAMLLLTSNISFAAEKPNVVIIYGDDVGEQENVAKDKQNVATEMKEMLQRLVDSSGGIRAVERRADKRGADKRGAVK